MPTEIKVHVRLENGQHLSHANLDRITAKIGGRYYRLHYAAKRDGVRTDRAGYYFWEVAPGGCGMCGTHSSIRSLVITAVAECGAQVTVGTTA